MSEQYTVLPEFYDILNTEADYDSYVEYLKKYLPQSSSVIDLGCGTGEISIRLAESGYRVTGLDISSEMLSAAYNKAEKKRADVFFTCQDMTSFSVPHLYDAAVSCFDSFNYILSKKELQNAFVSVANALVSDGVFLFDMNAPAKFEDLYADNTFVIEEDGVFCVWENEYNKKSRRCRFYINIFVSENDKYTRYYEEQCERSYKLCDIMESLKNAGFENVTVSADFDNSPVTSNTQRFYFTARKR